MHRHPRPFSQWEKGAELLRIAERIVQQSLLPDAVAPRLPALVCEVGSAILECDGFRGNEYMTLIFFTTFGAVFVAEIVGDKLLYTTGVLAARYRTAPIML